MVKSNLKKVEEGKRISFFWITGSTLKESLLSLEKSVYFMFSTKYSHTFVRVKNFAIKIHMKK